MLPTAMAQPWKPMSRSYRHTVFVLMLLPQEVWSSAITESAGCWQLLSTMRLSTLRAVTLCGLTLCGWVAVVPECCHFAIMPLTVECWMSRRKEISQRLLKVTSYYTTTVEFSDLLERTILSQMFATTNCMARKVIFLHFYQQISYKCGTTS